ncbi:Fc receptor-like protein 5 [Clarias gariepinus]|uniref:Fc receptor-like protein 5 n=1 Tax=Clarias gariepinus TaxID=13013 RepID=UPI00234D025D|nr:Fc receptor-like protein 5 [Clarias gariepinus]
MELRPPPVMLLLISLMAHAQGSPKAVLSIMPDTLVFIGECVTLRCDMQEGKDSQGPYSWNQNFIKKYQSGDNLFTLRNVQIIGSDYYTCQEWNSKISEPVTLTVSAKPKPALKSSVNPQSSIYTGDTVTLTCELKQSTGWEFLWYKYNEQLQLLSTEHLYCNTLHVTVINEEESIYKCQARRHNTWILTYYDTDLSDPVRITARERPAVLSVSPQSWLTEGDSVTLNCEVTDSSTDWTFSWYRVVPYRDSTGQISYKLIPLSDSSRGSGGSYTLSPADLKHTGVYACRGERGKPPFYTHYSNLQPLWITGNFPLVSQIINPNRIQHFTKGSLSLSCKDQNNSTGWTVRRYKQNNTVSDCSQWGSVTESTCNISSLSTSYTGVYWCESESGENSNPVNITVHDGDVILESPVHPVTEGHPLTLRCLDRHTKPLNLRADFSKDGSVLQNQTTGEMIIHKVSKSDEGFYHCKHPERGESLKNWVSVRRSSSSGGSVLVAVGLGISFIILLIIIILLLLYSRSKEKQQMPNQASQQIQSRSGDEDSQLGHTPLHAGNKHTVDQESGAGIDIYECNVFLKQMANENAAL